ncbi:hypothetical protein [Desulfurococcus mucosus]|uniref:hypothetical protein n=1 Tax=Desulfurococcus mucosus TaxID=2275 RepID=UPI000AF73C61|nr:hypothetical protein [Desulfurococcus mucosus]
MELPKHLADWLESFSREIAMRPSQFIATILTYFYEAWKVGRESAFAATREPYKKKEQSLDEIVERFSREVKLGRNIFILRKFVSWIQQRGLGVGSIDEEAVNAFLNAYLEGRAVKKNTVDRYRGILRRFVEYLATKRDTD